MSIEPLFENPAQSFDRLSAFAAREELESPEIYRNALEAASEVLTRQGGLVHLPDAPTIVIPDLHARREMLIAILDAQIAEGHLAGRQVFELLQERRINVICVGDIVHSEDRDKWVINQDGEWTLELLNKEMVRSLGAAMMVMYLKLQFPEHFYCLRGNHDDMAAELSPYRKFVGLRDDKLVMIDGQPAKGESGIIKDWVLEREGWGQEFLDAWTTFERALPLFAQGSYYVVTHTLPSVPLTEAELRNPNRPKAVTMELTWSRGIKGEAIEGTLNNLGIRESTQRWFYGHSVVPAEINAGKYEEGLDGLIVRLNNSKRFVFAYVPASQDERRFEPAKDVYIEAAAKKYFQH